MLTRKDMACLKISEVKSNSHVVIMIFVEGTILKPKSWFSLYRCNHYIPIGECVSKIAKWQEQGAEIVYCTSRRKNVGNVGMLLKQHGFVGSLLYFRGKGQGYKDIVESVEPHILIEDDCRSIGGCWQTCIRRVDPLLRKRIKSVVVPEFKGIDALPASWRDLLSGEKTCRE